LEYPARRGTVFQREWCSVVDQAPADLDVVRYWGLAATEKTEFNDPDWTVGVKLGRDRSGGYWIVQILDADPKTDWSKVDFEALRQHLIDMNEVTLKAKQPQNRSTGVWKSPSPAPGGRSWRSNGLSLPGASDGRPSGVDHESYPVAEWRAS
jgi:hypothetical protein